jgi:hypothetical protein
MASALFSSHKSHKTYSNDLELELTHCLIDKNSDDADDKDIDNDVNGNDGNDDIKDTKHHGDNKKNEFIEDTIDDIIDNDKNKRTIMNVDLTSQNRMSYRELEENSYVRTVFAGTTIFFVAIFLVIMTIIYAIQTVNLYKIDYCVKNVPDYFYINSITTLRNISLANCIFICVTGVIISTFFCSYDRKFIFNTLMIVVIGYFCYLNIHTLKNTYLEPYAAMINYPYTYPSTYPEYNAYNMLYDFNCDKHLISGHLNVLEVRRMFMATIGYYIFVGMILLVDMCFEAYYETDKIFVCDVSNDNDCNKKSDDKKSDDKKSDDKIIDNKINVIN